MKFKTNGQGYWSQVARMVQITDINVSTWGEDDAGELCVYFDTATWNVDRDGLIYTDPGFLQDLRLFLDRHGITGADANYSEQGMQGEDYVSLDVGREFLESWRATGRVVQDASA